MMYVGIDPGLSGAAALLSEQGTVVEVCSLPIMANNKATGKIKNCINAKELHSLLYSWEFEHQEILSCWIEQVSSRPGDGVSSAFSFGETFGAIRAVCACLDLRVNYVRPSAWKNYFKIGSDKEVARALAINLFPAASDHLSKKKDHDKAEAILIAHYGSLQHG